MKKCKICKGEGWVCEDHADKAWGEGDACCGGAGIPCVCNKTPLVRGYGDFSIDIFIKSQHTSPPEFDKTFRQNFNKLLA